MGARHRGRGGMRAAGAALVSLALLAACSGEDAGPLPKPAPEQAVRSGRETVSRPADEPDPQDTAPAFEDGDYTGARSFLSHLVSVFLYENYDGILVEHVYVQPHADTEDTPCTKIQVELADDGGHDREKIAAALWARFGYSQLEILDVRDLRMGEYGWAYEE